MSPKFESGPGPDNGPGVLLDDDITVVVGAVVETLPERAPNVACRLEGIEGLDVVGGDGDRRLAIVWCAPSARELERAMDRLIKGDEEILGIFPTFMGRDEMEEARARSEALEKLTEHDDA